MLALQLGMWRGCQRTHQAYPEQLGNCPLVVNDEGSEDLLMERFSHLVSVGEGDLAGGSEDGGKDEKKMVADG